VQIPDSVSISALWNDYDYVRNSLWISPNFTRGSEMCSILRLVFRKPYNGSRYPILEVFKFGFSLFWALVTTFFNGPAPNSIQC